jgi:hypothetical protein
MLHRICCHRRKRRKSLHRGLVPSFQSNKTVYNFYKSSPDILFAKIFLDDFLCLISIDYI